MGEPQLDVVKRLVHDLRTPLTIVEGFAHLLERDDATMDPDQRVEYAHRIKAAAGEMRELLDAVD
jgi:K+-sensing histidine kinase KdpD